ncbi:hypothetical protein SCUP515_03135 [Seiridium cupressi]
MHPFHADRHHPYFPQTPPRNFEHQSHNGRHAAPDYWSSNRSMLIALEPRPFIVLHQERECLAHHLNFVDEWATHLYRQLAYYDERISHLEGKERNDARKEQQWLRKRICDSLEDQKAITLRLGELHIEIQSRERWCAIRRERDEANIIGFLDGVGTNLQTGQDSRRTIGRLSIIPESHTIHLCNTGFHFPCPLVIKAAILLRTNTRDFQANMVNIDNTQTPEGTSNIIICTRRSRGP